MGEHDDRKPAALDLQNRNKKDESETYRQHVTELDGDNDNKLAELPQSLRQLVDPEDAKIKSAMACRIDMAGQIKEASSNTMYQSLQSSTYWSDSECESEELLTPQEIQDQRTKLSERQSLQSTISKSNDNYDEEVLHLPGAHAVRPSTSSNNNVTRHHRGKARRVGHMMHQTPASVPNQNDYSSSQRYRNHTPDSSMITGEEIGMQVASSCEGSLIEAEIAPDIDMVVQNALRRAISTYEETETHYTGETHYTSGSDGADISPDIDMAIKNAVRRASIEMSKEESQKRAAEELQQRLSELPQGHEVSVLAEKEATQAWYRNRNLLRWFLVVFAFLVVVVGGALVALPVTKNGNPSEQVVSTPPPSLSAVDEMANRLMPGKVIEQGSYQYRAMLWLLEEDPLMLYLSPVNTNELLERFSLVAVYFSTAGEFWSDNTRWLTGTSHCTWAGVYCYNGSISDLNLNSNKLDGEIPFELAYLSNLKRLNLGSNSLAGNIPGTLLGKFGNLLHIELDNNSLEGKIPTEVGLMSSLKRLELNSNFLKGSIPTEVGLLSSLTRMHLSYNGIEGSLPNQLSELTKLEFADFSLNRLTGNVPSSSFGQLTSLTELYLQSNELSSGLEELFCYHTLQHFEADCAGALTCTCCTNCY